MNLLTNPWQLLPVLLLFLIGISVVSADLIVGVPSWIFAVGAIIVAIIYFGGNDLLKPLPRLVPAAAIIVAFALWIGLTATDQIGGNIGDSLVELTDGDGVLFRSNDPTQTRVYRGSGRNPATLPNVQIGEWRTFNFDGVVLANTAPGGTRCSYTRAHVLVSDDAFAIYSSDEADTVTVLMIPAGDRCPASLPTAQGPEQEGPGQYGLTGSS